MKPVHIIPKVVPFQLGMVKQGYRPADISYEFWLIYTQQYPSYYELFKLNAYLRVRDRAYFLWRFDRITGRFRFDDTLNNFLMPA